MPGIPIGAYAATATEHVRQDVAGHLQLDRPEILVGGFDRPNLIYRVCCRTNALRQIRDVLDRRWGESGIIYYIRSADVDEMTQTLSGQGYRVAPYHTGMRGQDSKKSQNVFINDDLDFIVATPMPSRIEADAQRFDQELLEEIPQQENRWDGECFVFDTRVAVDRDLTEGGYVQCHACRRTLSAEDLASPDYREGVSCPKCVNELDADREARLEERHKQVELAAERGDVHIGPR